MPTHFIFPASPLRPTTVDEMFADQFAAFANAGFSTSLCPDPVTQSGKALRNIPAGATVVYRGWMFNATEYQRLVHAIESAVAKPLTSAAAYLAAHHLP